MEIKDSINRVISSEIPDPQYNSPIERLAEMLTQLLSGALSPMQVQDLIASDSEIHQITELLAGKQLPATNSILYFGDESNTGDITINDVAGQNIFKLTFNVYNAVQEPKPHGTKGQGNVFTNDEVRFFQLFILQAGEQALGKSFSLIRRGNRKYLRRENIEIVVALSDRNLIDLARKGFLKIYTGSNPICIVIQADFLAYMSDASV